MNIKRKTLIVTEKQLQVIKDACELYGRIQLGQFYMISEIITQTGISAYRIRVNPKRNDDETDDQYKARCRERYEEDMIVNDCIEGALDGIYRNAYKNYGKPRTNECNVAIDIWAKLDGRREDSNFRFGSEPIMRVEDFDEKEWE